MEGVARHMRSLGFNPKTIIDVGVAHGTYELYATWPGADLLLIEPMAEFEAAMRFIRKRRRTRCEYVIAAATRSNGTANLYHSDYSGGASLALGQPHSCTVQARTLDSIVSEQGFEPPFLLKVDVQGAEMDVLAGAEKTLPGCEVVMLETSLFDFAANGATILEITALMRTLGFVPYDIYDGLLRPHDRALGQIDIAFVKAGGRFRTSNAWG